MSETPEVLIRIFQPGDLPALTDLERSVFGSGAYSYHFFRQVHDLFPRLVWVAECRGAVVGHICAAIAQDGATGWILNLAVQAHFRRLGVGGRLLAQALDHLRQGGAQVVYAALDPENAVVIAAFAKLGFVQVGIGENYYGDGVDRVLMAYTVTGR